MDPIVLLTFSGIYGNSMEFHMFHMEHLGSSINGDGWFTMENPIKIDDLGYSHDLGNLHLVLVTNKNPFMVYVITKNTFITSYTPL